jgi:phosphatidate cytidylyltransferase
MKDIKTRIATGIIFLIVMVSSVVFSEISFLIIYSLVTMLCLNEYHNITESVVHTDTKLLNQYKIINTIFAAIIFLIVYLVASKRVEVISLSLIGGFTLFWFIIEMFANSKNPFLNLSINSFGLFYIAIPFSGASLIAFYFGEYNWNLVLAVMIFAWSNDSFAYLFGSLFGKHKLFERISPKKSWEGFIGGILGTIAFSYLVYLLFPKWSHQEVAYIHYLILAIITSVISTFGDLAESLIKRSLKVKDTGSVLPGHGGFLDRFDGLIFSFPAAALYLTFISKI